MYARMLGLSRRLAAAQDRRRRRPRLPRRRPPGALPRPVQLPLLARRVRRPVPAPPPQRDLSPPDRRPQRPRRRRGARPAPASSLDVADFNLDARQEVRLENDRLIALVRPATGGHVYELDVRHALTNVLATLDRRPEAYHGDDRRGGRRPAERERRPGDQRASRPEAGRARPAPRLRPPPAQGARRSLLSRRRHPRTTCRLPRRRAGRLRRRAPTSPRSSAARIASP